MADDNIVQLNGNGLFLRPAGPTEGGGSTGTTREFFILEEEAFKEIYGDSNYLNIDHTNSRCKDMMAWRTNQSPADLTTSCREKTGDCTIKIGIPGAPRVGIDESCVPKDPNAIPVPNCSFTPGDSSTCGSECNYIAPVTALAGGNIGKINWIDGYDYDRGVLCSYGSKSDVGSKDARCTGDQNEPRYSSAGQKVQDPYRECLIHNTLEQRMKQRGPTPWRDEL